MAVRFNAIFAWAILAASAILVVGCGVSPTPAHVAAAEEPAATSAVYDGCGAPLRVVVFQDKTGSGGRMRTPQIT